MTLQLSASVRTVTGKQVAELRAKGLVPGVMYGNQLEPKLVSIELAKLERLYRDAGESTLIDVVLDGQEPVKVLFKDVQRDPQTDKIVHVDFQQVRADQKISVEVALQFIGEAPAVKELGGILVTNHDHMEIECLPKDLVHEIAVDVSALKTFDDQIKYADIVLPPGVTLLNEPDDVVALVQEPRSQQELDALDAAPVTAVAAPEKVGEKKEEPAQAAE